MDGKTDKMQNINIERKKLLCIIGSLGMGGAETFIIKILEALDKDLYMIDFALINTTETHNYKLAKKYGSEIFKIPAKNKNIFSSFKTIKKIVKENSYKYVLRISGSSLAAIDLLAAKFGGAKVLALRSTNSKSTAGLFGTMLHYIFRPLANVIVNRRIAPSQNSAKFMFGLFYRKTTILANGINASNYAFNYVKRDEMRKRLNIDDKFVIGHVGRFNKQKNHKFLIKVFFELQKIHSNSCLVLVGTGELKKNVKEQVEFLNIDNKTIFIDVENDMQRLLSTLDFFIFPSRFEGLPNVLIEAQANGLPVLCSDNISEEAVISNSVKRVRLDFGPKKWADIISTNLELFKKKPRQECYKEIIGSNYNIEKTSLEFNDIIFFNGDLKNNEATKNY